jgi:starvation-inducible outer membrane lipoprotein
MSASSGTIVNVADQKNISNLEGVDVACDSGKKATRQCQVEGRMI